MRELGVQPGLSDSVRKLHRAQAEARAAKRKSVEEEWEDLSGGGGVASGGGAAGGGGVRGGHRLYSMVPPPSKLDVSFDHHKSSKIQAKINAGKLLIDNLRERVEICRNEDKRDALSDQLDELLMKQGEYIQEQMMEIEDTR